MAKKQKQRNGMFNRKENQPTSQEKSTMLFEMKKAEKEQELLKDDRIQEKIREYQEKKNEYERKIEENENVLIQKEEALKGKYEQLTAQINENIASKEREIEDEKQALEQNRKKIAEERERIIKELKHEEEEIQKAYREELHAKWEKDYEQKLAQNKEILQKAEESYNQSLAKSEVIIAQANQKVVVAQETAHQIKMQADSERMSLIQATQEKIQRDSENYIADYEQKIQDLSNREAKIKRQERLLLLAEEDLAILKEDLANQRALYNQKFNELSPKKIAELQYEISELNDLRQLDQEFIQKLKENLRHLSKLVPEDEQRSVHTIVDELESARRENSRLKDELAQFPSTEELMSLRAKAQKVELLEERLNQEQRQKLVAEERANAISLGVIELEQSKRVAETLKALNAQLQDELNKMNEIFKANAKSKFPSLLEIDSKIEKQDVIRSTKNGITLEGLVKYLRQFGANQMGLYYTEKTIRAFIASLAASKLLILQGLSGTGKSSLPRLMKEALQLDQTLIPVQPTWRDNRELLGYDNDFTGRFKETMFTKKVYEASAPENREKMYFIVLDEMNLARIEYYFADFLAVLEEAPENWIIELVSSNIGPGSSNPPKHLAANGTSLHVTPNIWFIGTANRDESTFGITDKVYDRAQILNFNSREPEFTAEAQRKLCISFSEFSNLLDEAMETKAYNLSADDWAQIDYLDEFLQTNLEITFGNRIKTQMERFVAVYVATGGTKMEAIDHLIAQKVLRKLEGRHEIYLKVSLKELLDHIDDEFGRENLTECKKLITQKITRLGG